MKTADELMLIPHKEGYRAWRSKAGQTTPGETESRAWRGAEWIALPSRCVISVPMRFQGIDASRRESAAQLELEAAGLGTETADSTNFELIPLSKDDRDQRAATYIQAAPLPAAILENGNDAQFAPSVAFKQLTPGEILIWREESRWVLAIPHDQGGAMHFQGLSSLRLDADAAAEIRCILASLELAGMQPDLHSVSIMMDPEDQELLDEDFSHDLDLPVIQKEESIPHHPEAASRLVPTTVVRYRHERQQRRMMMMGVLAFTFVLIAALSAFALRVLMRERSIMAEERRLDDLETDLQTIRDAKANWEDILPALSPDTYPIESIYQLVNLLPPEGIRLTRFEIRLDGIVLDGEASSLGHGIEFRDRLIAAPAFKHWQWEFPQPTSLPDGRATFRAEARSAEEAAKEENTEVTQL
jgi:hypothetical protein